MATLLRLLFLVPIAMVLALLAGVAVFVLAIGGLKVDPADPADIVELVTVSGIVLGRAAAIGGPIFLVGVVVAEAFRLRGMILWALFGGATGLATALLAGMSDGQPGDGRLVAPLAAGFVAGLVYWLLSGRLSGAGLGRPEAPPLTSPERE